MTDSKRKHPWQERLDEPLKSPEVDEAIRDVDGNFAVRVTIPRNTSELMREVGTLVKEIIGLVAFINPDTEDYLLEEIEALAVLAGISLHYTIDPVAPMPQSDDSIEGYKAKMKRYRMLKEKMGIKTVAVIASRREMPRSWIPKSHPLDGWLLAVDRLADAARKLTEIEKKITGFRADVKKRAKILKDGCACPDVKLPSSPDGGPPPMANRIYAENLAIYLQNPTKMDPPKDFEPWTAKELAALFNALGLKEVGNTQKVEDLLRQLRPVWKSLREYQIRSVNFPRIQRPPKVD